MQTCVYPVTWKLFRREALLEQFQGRAWNINKSLFVITLFFIFVLTTGRYIPFFLACLAVLLYFLLLHWLVMARKRYKTFSVLWGGENWDRTMVFRTSSLIVREGRASHEISYRALLKLREKSGEAVLLYRGGVLVIPTDTFTDGTWEEVRAKLTAALPRRRGTRDTSPPHKA